MSQQCPICRQGYCVGGIFSGIPPFRNRYTAASTRSGCSSSGTVPRRKPRQFFQVVNRETSPGRIRDQHKPFTVSQARYPLLLHPAVTDVGHQQHFPWVLLAVDEVRGARCDAHAVDRRIPFDGRQGHRIDIRGDHLGRAGLGGRDGGDSRARPEIDDPPAADPLRMVQEVTCQCLAAGPGEAPIGRRAVVSKQPPARGLPERRVFAKQAQRDFRAEGGRPRGRVGFDQSDCVSVIRFTAPFRRSGTSCTAWRRRLRRCG